GCRSIPPANQVLAGRLIQEIGPIERIALPGHEPRVADHPAEFLLAGPMVGPGRRYHVLFDHDAADIIPAEAETKLAGLEALRDPGTLDVLEVIKIDPGDR